MLEISTLMYTLVRNCCSSCLCTRQWKRRGYCVGLTLFFPQFVFFSEIRGDEKGTFVPFVKDNSIDKVLVDSGIDKAKFNFKEVFEILSL